MVHNSDSIIKEIGNFVQQGFPASATSGQEGAWWLNGYDFCLKEEN